MVFTLREEIVILTLIFCFCMFTIPLILITANENRKVNRIKPIEIRKDFNELGFKQQVLIDSISVLESQRKESRITLIDLINSTDDDLHKHYPNLKIGSHSSASPKQVRNVWKKFEFTNGTVLKSKSLRLPLKVDWRRNDVVTEIQNQKGCGSCFAVGVIETVESMVALKTGKLDGLSVQQMLDCNENEMSCSGGDPCRLLDWLLDSQVHVQLRENYPTSNTNSKQKCDEKRLQASGIKVKDYSCNKFLDKEELILLYLAKHGPMVAAINGVPLQYYMNGVVQHNCNSGFKELNHVVQIVGYDLTGPVPFYIVKNSWGLHFGTSGYLRMAIGRNTCGIARKVSAVVV